MTTKPENWIVAELTRRPCPLLYYYAIRTGEDRDDAKIAVVPSNYPEPDGAAEANAYLIAAAPKLLEALKTSVACLEAIEKQMITQGVDVAAHKCGAAIFMARAAISATKC